MSPRPVTVLPPLSLSCFRHISWMKLILRHHNRHNSVKKLELSAAATIGEIYGLQQTGYRRFF